MAANGLGDLTQPVKETGGGTAIPDVLKSMSQNVFAAPATTPSQQNATPTATPNAAAPGDPVPQDKNPPYPSPASQPPAQLQPPAQTPQGSDLVETRLNGLLSSNSDYMRMARAAGERTAAARGLQNSSIAAGAAQGAAIERALPIAQQDATTVGEFERLQQSDYDESIRLAQAAGYDMDRLKAQAGFDITRDAANAKSAQDLARIQGEIQSKLSAQGNSEQIQRMGVDLTNQLQLQDKQLTSDLAKIAASGNEEVRRIVEAANQERVTLQQSIASQDRQAMGQAMVNIFQIEAQMRASLLGNTSIPASERAAYERTIASLGNPIRDYIGKLYGGTLTPGPAIPGTGVVGGVPTGDGSIPGGGGLLPGGGDLGGGLGGGGGGGGSNDVQAYYNPGPAPSTPGMDIYSPYTGGVPDSGGGSSAQEEINRALKEKLNNETYA